MTNQTKVYDAPATREGWDNNVDSYRKLWEQKKTRIWFATQEESYISQSIEYWFDNNKNKAKVLDVGIGAGRILDIYIKSNHSMDINGIDYSEKMVKYNKERLASHKDIKLQTLNAQNIDKLDLQGLDIITVIRLLKYIDPVEPTISKIIKKLKPGGIVIFSLPNKNSLTNLSKINRDSLTIESYSDVKKIIESKENNCEIIFSGGYNRLPEFLYLNNSISKIIIWSEILLHKILRKHHFAREMFITIKKR